MRRLGIVLGLVAVATLGASVPAIAEPPTPRRIEPIAATDVLGLDIRYLDRDGHARVLRVEDFPR